MARDKPRRKCIAEGLVSAIGSLGRPVLDAIIAGDIDDVDGLAAIVNGIERRARCDESDSFLEQARTTAGIFTGRSIAKIEVDYAAQMGNLSRDASELNDLMRSWAAWWTLPAKLRLHLMLGRWKRHGGEVYVLDDALCEAFANTPPLMLDHDDDVRPPSKALVVLGDSVDAVVIDGPDGVEITTSHDMAADIHLAFRVTKSNYLTTSALDRNDEKMAEIRVVLNLLTALQDTKLLMVEQRDPKRPSRRAEAKANGKGRVFSPYRYVYIDGYRRVVRDQKRQARQSSGSSKRLHLCSGHWSRYWVRKPGDLDKPDALRESTGKVGGHLHRVTRWIAPHWRGSGKVEPRTTIVKPLKSRGS